MAKWKAFFIFCSGIDPNLLDKCPTEANKYIGIGATVFFTGVLAFLSSGYAIHTVFDSWVASIIFGLIWGLMIFNLDRYIVSSMKSQGSVWRDTLVALPRFGLAILLAIVISKPLELKIFEKEIEAELIKMEQEVFKEQEDLVKVRFEATRQDHLNQIAVLQEEISKKAAKRDELSMIALQEADGTGGSLKRNMGPIYRIKKNDAELAQSELDQVVATNTPKIEALQAQVNTVDESVESEIAAMEQASLGGLASRMDALGRLGQKSGVIFWASVFIMFLFIAIECAPIFVKLISQRSPYDYLLHELDHKFAMANLERTSLLASHVDNKLKYEVETSAHQTVARVAAEKELIDIAIKQRVEELKRTPVSWKDIFLKQGIL